MKFFTPDELEKAVSKSSRSRRLKEDFAYQLSRELVRARISKGLTQKELARLMRTSQSAIARAENGTSAPATSFLTRLAKIYKSYLIPPKFAFLDNQSSHSLKTDSGNASIEANGKVYASWVNYIESIDTRGREDGLSNRKLVTSIV